jgi:hypothetical protein
MAHSSDSSRKPKRKSLVQEHRIDTPRGDLFVLRVGVRENQLPKAPGVETATLLSRLARAVATPGVKREHIFPANSRNVYAYSIYPKDPSKIVRKDAKGNKVLGRLVDGRFRSLPVGQSL